MPAAARWPSAPLPAVIQPPKSWSRIVGADFQHVRRSSAACSPRPYQSRTGQAVVTSVFNQNQSHADGVVLLHGIARSARSLRRMQAALETAGFATLNLDYQSRAKSLEALVADISPAISGFASRIDGPVHFVAHSMGGLLARAYLAKYPLPRPGRVILLGPPNNGSEIADRFGILPFTARSSVPPASSWLRLRMLQREHYCQSQAIRSASSLAAARSIRFRLASCHRRMMDASRSPARDSTAWRITS